MAIDSALHTNRHSIDRLLNAGLPVVLVFWDRQRSPRRANSDELDRLAAKYAGRALIARVDAEEEAELLNRFQVNNVPAFVFVKDGQTVERTQVDDPAYIDAWLNHLANGGPRPAHPAASRAAGQTDGAGNGQASTNRSGAQAGHAASGKPVTLTDANFRSVTSGATPVLVDFWAEWCGPCHMVAPSIESLAQEFDGRAIVGKLNVEQNPVIAGQFGVRSIPTLLIFRNGRVVDQLVGAQPLPVLRQRLAAHVQ